MPHSVKAIANAFLNKAAESGQKLSHMKLHKLIYYACGYYLAVTNKPLIDSTFEAWEYGPVVPAIYHEFKDFGTRAITRPAREIDWDTEEYRPVPIPTSDKTAARVIDFVWEKYGKYSALQLSEMTHADGSPWDKTRKARPGIRDADIPDEYMTEHFSKFVVKKPQHV